MDSSACRREVYCVLQVGHAGECSAAFHGKDPKPEVVRALARYHVAHFENLVTLGERGVSGIRVGECREYLATWRRIAAADGEWSKLQPAERTEVIEALQSDGLA